MNKIVILFCLILLLLLFGCHNPISEEQNRNYVFIKTPVINTRENCGGGNWGGGCTYFAYIDYKGGENEVKTGISQFTRCNNIPNCTPESWSTDFEPKIGQIITIEGIYDKNEKYLKVLNVYPNTTFPKPEKRYIIANVSINIKKLYYDENNFDKEGDYIVSLSDNPCEFNQVNQSQVCKEPYGVPKIKDYGYAYFFDYEGKSYNFSIMNKYRCSDLPQNSNAIIEGLYYPEEKTLNIFIVHMNEKVYGQFIKSMREMSNDSLSSKYNVCYKNN